MSFDDTSRVVPIGQRRGASGLSSMKAHHDPVGTDIQDGGIQVLTFEGSAEASVLHAAGAWMAEHSYAVVIAANWKGDARIESGQGGKPDATPRYRFELVVNSDSEHGQYRNV